MSDKIDKPWVAFGIFKGSIGKIVKDNGLNVHVLYIENQTYPPEIWNIQYITRFETPKELAGYVSGYGEYTYDSAMEFLRVHFPSDFNKEK